MSRITRKELKSDRFALEVEHTVTFFGEHQKELIRYGGAALVVIALIVGYFMYSGRQHMVRQDLLARAISIQEAPVGPPQPGVNLNFPTQDVHDQAALKAFADIQTQYPSSDEGHIAHYYIASIKADQGKLAEAEKDFKEVADQDPSKYGALAKLALAQIYFSDGRADQGEALLRDLIAHPTILVSSDQATITLARAVITRKPAEARKLLEPLLSRPGAVGQTAVSLGSELPPPPQ